jgi:hypothetical protein
MMVVDGREDGENRRKTKGWRVVIFMREPMGRLGDEGRVSGGRGFALGWLRGWRHKGGSRPIRGSPEE